MENDSFESRQLSVLHGVEVLGQHTKDRGTGQERDGLLAGINDVAGRL